MVQSKSASAVEDMPRMRREGMDALMSEIGDEYINWGVDMEITIRMLSNRAAIEAQADALLLRSLRAAVRARRQLQAMADTGCEITDRVIRIALDVTLPDPLPAEAEVWREGWVSDALAARRLIDQHRDAGESPAQSRGVRSALVEAGWIRPAPPVRGPRLVTKRVTAPPMLTPPDLGCWA